MGWISKHTGRVTWAGQCTQSEECTQSECGFTLSNGQIGVAKLVSELNTYTISTAAPPTCMLRFTLIAHLAPAFLPHLSLALLVLLVPALMVLPFKLPFDSP